VRSIKIDISEAGIVLNGLCDSFQTKQMAQEIIRHNTRLPIVTNNLVVDYSNASKLPLIPSVDNSHASPPTKTQKAMMNPPRPFTKIFFPSDFSSDSEVAFVHALQIALKSKAFLQMMHVDANDQANWDDFPSVRSALERWKVLPEGSSKEQVNQLGVGISKVIASSTDPVQACLNYFEINDVDLIVLSVHQREGMMRWLGKMIGERISHGSKQNTLFIPAGRNGFVSPESGSVTLKNILIPVVEKPRAEPGVEFVQRLIRSLDLVTGSVSLLHVGPSETMPFVQQHPSNGWTWNRVRLEGERTETIVQFAKDIDANLIVMSTDGPDRVLDGLRGTTSERVLRKAHCPVAVIPVESIV
jgi:nucleotide-binding universal stress UspA family protein